MSRTARLGEEMLLKLICIAIAFISAGESHASDSRLEIPALKGYLLNLTSLPNDQVNILVTGYFYSESEYGSDPCSYAAEEFSVKDDGSYITDKVIVPPCEKSNPRSDWMFHLKYRWSSGSEDWNVLGGSYSALLHDKDVHHLTFIEVPQATVQLKTNDGSRLEDWLQKNYILDVVVSIEFFDHRFEVIEIFNGQGNKASGVVSFDRRFKLLFGQLRDDESVKVTIRTAMARKTLDQTLVQLKDLRKYFDSLQNKGLFVN